MLKIPKDSHRTFTDFLLGFEFFSKLQISRVIRREQDFASVVKNMIKTMIVVKTMILSLLAANSVEL